VDSASGLYCFKQLCGKRIWNGSSSAIRGGMGIHRLHGVGIVAGFVLLVHQSAAQGNTNAFSLSPQQMLDGVDAQSIRQLDEASRSLEANPNDVNALVMRGAVSLHIAATTKRYSYQWEFAAAKDLERAITLDPNNFYAEHNYAMACLQAGDFNPTQPAMHLAVTHFTKAIQMKPGSARSYMGRGWAYLMLREEAHANADFEKALQLDPGLRTQLVSEANAIRQKMGQLACAGGMVQRMGAYMVDRTARTADQCAARKEYWTGSECRISTAMAPGPLMADSQNSATANQGLGGGNCAPPPDAANYRYSSRAGGYVVR
jgi:tetratricopeptide (TPR) repeat protein